ncbi:MAG: hypothetical protein O7H39_02460 [Gammaproteobacteria bacterium]|nr:hypothetical protein [Gammaproteobacteria bacterium]
MRFMRFENVLGPQLAVFALASALLGCGGGGGGSSGSTTPTPASAPSAITIAGIASDGPVAGGEIVVYTADRVSTAIGGNPIETGAAVARRTRDSADGAEFEFAVPGTQAGNAIFVVLNTTNAEDLTFGDQPPTLESVAILGTAGSSQRLNITTHTTLIAQLVRASLDPDGDGTPISTASIATEIENAEALVMSALGEDESGDELFPDGMSPLDGEDDEVIHRASTVVGLLARTLSARLGLSLDTVIAALSADAGDGEIDGSIPSALAVSPELQTAVQAAGDFLSIFDDDEIDSLAAGPCSSSAVSLRRACGFDVVDDLLEELAICADTSDAGDEAECRTDVVSEVSEVSENVEECNDVFDARLEICEALDDAAHQPAFGGAFAANFVDPSEIGGAVAPNPYLPLIAGTTWVYETEDETVTVTVTTDTQLIDGVTCVVVTDVETEDGVVIEQTDDWFAQDVTGNVWYCGEISRNFEIFEGDVPEEPELVDIEGSWKHAREGAKAGILVPAAPEVGDVIRQEVLYGDAEDVIEILSLTATEAAPAASCAGDCLQTRDFTALEPDAEEHKYYAPGVGVIVEIDLEDGNRIELTSFSTP